MENFDQNFELIQEYIDGNLPAEQRTQVEERLEKDPDFARLYQRSKMTIQVIKQEAEQSTMAFLDGLHEKEIGQASQEKGAAKVRQMPLRRILSIAAVLALLITAGIWLFLPQNESLTAFENYYERPAFDMQRGAEGDPLLSEIARVYNAEDYMATLEKINTYENIEDTEIALKRYKAIALIETNRIKEAQDLLESLKGDGEQPDEIYWLSAMANLKADNQTAAIDDLKALLSGDFPVTEARKRKVNELLTLLQ
ncbi:MAG TPA: hypothetical protein VJ953_22325 [Saprospiraceae bacterium]|nr:hypothetical protein [Saprospiraceae bacterium]